MMFWLIFIIFIVVGVLILRVYYSVFSKNVEAIKIQGEIKRLPDLHDVVVGYIIICLLVVFSVSIFKVGDIYTTKVGNCASEFVSDVISVEFEYCKNDYGNVIFTDQKNALSLIYEKYDDTITNLLNTRPSFSSNELDNLYWNLENSRSGADEKQLFILLSIYRNFYETNYVEIKGLEG